MAGSERIVEPRTLLLRGDAVDRFVLSERLGTGGQGEVWRAEDPSSGGRHVALKLVQVAGATPNRLERLRREAEQLVALRHPSLIGCFGCFQDEARSLFGIVMELVTGRALDGVVGDTGLDPRQRVLVLGHVAAALAHVHAKGIVHRDVKLENVLLTEQFFRLPEDPASIRLIDFGIAVRSANPEPLTRAGHVVGTPPYLAPEQLEPGHWGGASPSAACDVFSFGVLAWRLLSRDAAAHPTRLGPEADVDDFAIAYRRAAHDRWPPSFANPKWDGFFRNALTLRPADRVRDGSELVRRLGTVPTVDEPPAQSARIRTIPGDPPAPFALPVPPTRSERMPRARTLRSTALYCALGALLALGLGLGWLLLHGGADDAPPPPNAPAKNVDRAQRGSPAR
jgi:eukaryotic-like serine/threonine-protein kinase